MKLFPDKYRFAKYDPVFWALAMTLAMATWGAALVLHIILLPVELLVVAVTGAWLVTMNKSEAPDRSENSDEDNEEHP